ncbi:hypothetical protein [Sphingomonas sp. IW22]|uniref:hypothetical protein n=1 Tax=Sphingomonas sp. IW22 TaxID=3242489 RepID=UPI003521673F
MAVAVTLPGCASNAIRLDYAGDVAGRAEVAAAASRRYLAEVDETRVAVNVDLIGMDTACVPNRAWIRRQADVGAIKASDFPPRGWLCAPGPLDGVTYPEPLSLAPLGPDLEPTFLLIDALGAYGAGIATILEEEGPDPAADLVHALALARSAEGLLRAMAGGAGQPVVPAADDVRLVAIDAFIAFVTELRTEQRKVDALRRTAGAGPLIAALRDHLSNWELGRQADENLRFELATALLGGAQRADAPQLSKAMRREFGAAYYEGAAGRTSSARFKAALDGTLGELAAAEADLRRVLAEDPDLTDAERREAARITRQRLTRAFDTLSRLLLAFGG